MRRLFTFITTTVLGIGALMAIPPERVSMPQSSLSERKEIKVKHRRASDRASIAEDITGTKLRIPNSASRLSVKSNRRAPAKLTSKGDVLFGYMTWSDDEEFEPGLFSFQPEGYDLVWVDQDYLDYSDESFSACWYDDGKVKGYKVLIYGGAPYYYSYVEADLATGEVLVNNEVDVDEPVQSFIQYHASYDADNDLVYGYGYVQQDNGYYRFGLARVIGTDPLSATMIRPLDDEIDDTPRSMCFNPEDKMLYAIDEGLRLLRIDPNDGDIEHLATLDIEDLDARYISGLAYHPLRKLFYWNICSSDGSSAMATITPGTWEVDVYEQLELGEEFVSIFTTEETPAPNRPERPVFKSFDFEDGSTTGSITFTMPSKLGNGDEITEALTWHCSLDGTESSSGTAQAGADVVVPFKDIADGMHMFSFNVSTGKETSRTVNYRSYVGNDTPVMPRNVQLTHSSISWDEVTTGIHGGFVDTDKMMYQVYLNDKQIATTAETSVDIEIPVDGELTGYTASVLAECNGFVSSPSLSNGIVSGDPLKLPVYLLPTEDDFAKMTQYYYEVNDDAEKWTWEEGDEYSDATVASGWTVDEETELDTWLFLPPAAFDDASKFYTFSFDARLRSSMYPDEYIEVALCTDPDPETAVSTIMDEFTPALYGFSNYSCIFEIPQAGTYYVAIHCTAAPEQFGTRFNHFRIEGADISPMSPAAATDLSAVPGENGALTATVTFTMPETTFVGLGYEGEPLSPDASLTATVTAASATTVSGKPGETVTAEVATAQGTNTISIVVENADGLKSEPAVVEVYTGVVAPVSVSNVRTVESENMLEATISWDAPTQGVGDGYIEPDKITYTIYQIIGQEFRTIAEGFNRTSFSVSVPEGTAQGAYNFGIMATNAAGSNGYYVAATAVLGTPIDLPVIEMFDNPEQPYATTPWFSSRPTDDYTASLGWTMLKNYDSEKYGDSETGGLIAVGRAAGSKGRISTPRFSTLSMDKVTIDIEAIDFEDAGNIVLYANSFDAGIEKIGEIVAENSGAVKSYSFELPASALDYKWVGIIIDFEFAKPGACFIESLKINGKNAGVDSVINSESVTISSGDGFVNVKGFNGVVSVASVDGRTVAEEESAGDTTVSLQPGIYIVKAGSKISKVVVR